MAGVLGLRLGSAPPSPGGYPHYVYTSDQILALRARSGAQDVHSQGASRDNMHGAPRGLRGQRPASGDHMTKAARCVDGTRWFAPDFGGNAAQDTASPALAHGRLSRQPSAKDALRVGVPAVADGALLASFNAVGAPSTAGALSSPGDHAMLNGDSLPRDTKALPRPPCHHESMHTHGLLHAGLCAYTDEVQASFAKQVPARDNLAQLLEQEVRALWPGAEVRVYGSCSAMLASTASDLDLVVCNWLSDTMLQACKTQGASRALQAECVHRLAAQLRTGRPWLQSLDVFTSSTVPIVALVCPLERGTETNVDGGGSGDDGTDDEFTVHVDLSFFAPGHHGLRTMAVMQQLVCNNPPLVPLVLFVKALLKGVGLNKPFNGGLSSYGVVIMCMRVLRDEFRQLADESADRADEQMRSLNAAARATPFRALPVSLRTPAAAESPSTPASAVHSEAVSAVNANQMLVHTFTVAAAGLPLAPMSHRPGPGGLSSPKLSAVFGAGDAAPSPAPHTASDLLRVTNLGCVLVRFLSRFSEGNFAPDEEVRIAPAPMHALVSSRQPLGAR